MKKILLIIFAFMSVSQSFAQNVGIGTNTPAAKLEVTAADSNAAMISNSQSPALDGKTRLYFRNGIYYTGAIGTHITQTTSGPPYARLGFFTYGGSSPNFLLERMSISDDGFVGINNTNPTSTLDVIGTFKLQGNGAGNGKVLTSDANGVATWQTPSSSSSFSLPFIGGVVGGNTPSFGVSANGNAGNAATIYGANESTMTASNTNGPAGVMGEITTTSPTQFAAGVRGVNRSTTANGVGVLGYHDGLGYAMYGYSISGTGVAGNTFGGTAGSFTAIGGTGLRTSSSSGLALSTTGNVKMTGIGEASGKVLTSDASGNATWQTPASPAGVGFVARLTNNITISSSTDITGYTESSDDGNGFNPTTGIYTVPSSGMYLFRARATYNVPANMIFTLRFNYPGWYEQNSISNVPIPGYSGSGEITMLKKCTTGDAINLTLLHSYSGNITINGGNQTPLWFSGVKLY